MYFILKKVEEIKLYLKNTLSEEHYILIQNATDDSREKEFLKKNKQLIEKYNSLLAKYSRHSNYKTSLIKPAILNLTKEEIPKHYESLLNPGPKFVSTNKNLPFMDIIRSTESCALDMEHNHKENEAETLRQNFSKILQKKKVDILFKTKYIYSLIFQNLIVSFKSSSMKRSSLLPMIAS